MKIIISLLTSLLLVSSAFADNLVRTPAGLLPSSQVHVLLPGQIVSVEADHYEILNAKHQLVQSIPKLKTSHRPDFTSGWVAYSSWANTSGKPITAFSTNWVVPQAPSQTDDQILYFFNGIEPANMDAILQPVLQWGLTPAGGGRYWGVASWFVTSDAQAFCTQVTKVNAGDHLRGVMSLTSSIHHQLYNYISQFSGIPSTTLMVLNLSELTWASETLEVYNIASCHDYPTGSLAFKNIAMQMGSNTIDWMTHTNVDDCGQQATVVSHSAENGEVDISF